MLKALIFTLSLLLVTSLAFAQTPAEIAARFPSEFKSILVDVRNSRFGAGDVAASYLTITDFIKTYKTKNKISILTNDVSAKILRSLAHGNQEFFDHVNIYSLNTIPADKNFDLYISLANKDGQFQNQMDFSERFPNRPVHLDKDAVLINQTVLGNTENKLFHLKNATLRFHGKDYNLSYPGLGDQNAGVYVDFVAKKLRPLSAQQVSDYVIENLYLVDDQFSSNALREILDGTKLAGAKVGLAYGLSSVKTQQPQFLTYLQGLASSAGGSFCVITPSSVDPQSGFSEASVTDPELMRKLIFIKDLESMPPKAEAGKIYIVRTRNLPHSIFVGLVARSMKQGLVPVGAGDGFISAALNLGGPFVLTRVPWNAKNIEAFKQRLMTAVPEHRDLIEDIFGKIDLTRSQDLRALTQAFEEIGRSTPSFTERLINAAYLTKHFDGAKTDEIADVLLRADLIAKGIEKEFPQFAEQIQIEPLREKPRTLIQNVPYSSMKMSCTKSALPE